MRLYREQKRALNAEDRLSLYDDDRDDSSSCTNSASNIATADAQPAPVSFIIPRRDCVSCQCIRRCMRKQLRGVARQGVVAVDVWPFLRRFDISDRARWQTYML